MCQRYRRVARPAGEKRSTPPSSSSGGSYEPTEDSVSPREGPSLRGTLSTCTAGLDIPGLSLEGCSNLAVVQQALFLAITWASIGVLGSFYVLRSLAQARPHTDGRSGGVYYRFSDTTNIVTDYVEQDDGSMFPVESVPFPESWRNLRFHALVLFGAFGGLALVITLVLALIGWRHGKTRRWLLHQLVFGGPDWTT